MFPRPNPFFALLCAGSLATASLPFAHSQAGDARDSEGVEQNDIWRDMDVPPAPVLTPVQAIDSFTLEPGYSLELVAAEPLVNDPVAIAWDERGRLWVAEMWAYMPDVDGTGEDRPVSRVVILEDLDQDGKMDRSTVFLDKLVLPRAIAIVKGGALIGDPPNLYFCEDTDGDLVSDRQTIVAEYATEGNVEHSENGLMRGLDNWLYNAKSSRRFKFIDGRIHEEQTHFRGQWGITQDDYGRIYYNSNSFYLYGDMTPWQNLSQHPGHSPKAGFEHPVAPDRSVFTARVNPGVNRGYLEETLAEDFRLAKITAASAPSISRSKRYPSNIHGNAFVPEPSGNVVSRFELHDNELFVTAEKKLHQDQQWGPVEFLASTDERFRPVATATGPDGFTYVVDFYRGILQHKTYLTSFLRKQIIERGLDNPVGHGRIYRIVHESDNDSRALPKLADLPSLDLVPFLGDSNGWVRDTAQRLIVESETKSEPTLEALRLATRSGDELSRIHALWTLQGLDALDLDTAALAYEEGSGWVAVHALRSAEARLEQARVSKHRFWKSYQDALTSQSLRIRLQALQSLRHAADPDFELQAISSLSPEDLANPFIIDAAVSVSHTQEAELLQLAIDSKSPSSFSPLISSLTEAIFKERNAESAARFAETALSQATPDSVRAAIENGLANALKVKKPKALALPTPLRTAPAPESIYFQALTWPGKVDPNAVVEYQYTDADLASINRGKPLYTNTCAICHNANGLGTPSLAPSLAGSEWVQGSKERLALIVGQGLTGPIVVSGETWNSIMPPHGEHPALSGEAFNDLLNYLRASWDNNASPYSPGEARNYLQKHANNPIPWTVEKLAELNLK